MELQRSTEFTGNNQPLGVSIVMPCLNEIHSLEHCLDNARDALDQIAAKYGLAGEIVIADNGSTDGSQALAERLGARVVDVPRKGYGAAIIGGFDSAFGQFLVMGDCDGSYDFTNSVPMIGRLLDGADLCMGSRFKGGISPGAMPWKNRYIGNPLLTGILNLFFRSGIEDAHCGLRAIRKETYTQLGLQGAGMEFASEMVIKASLRKMRIDEVPATLSADLRDRAPHLRPWRDGWRHLRYLLMLSPTWVFGVPALLAMTLACLILSISALHALGMLPGAGVFGVSWTIIGGFLLTLGHFAAIMALATHFHGVKLGYRQLRPSLARRSNLLTLEHALISGALLMVISAVGFGVVGWDWITSGFIAPTSILPVTLSAAAGVLGLQNVMGGFLVAIIGGHETRYISNSSEADYFAVSESVSAA